MTSIQPIVTVASTGQGARASAGPSGTSRFDTLLDTTGAPSSPTGDTGTAAATVVGAGPGQPAAPVQPTQTPAAGKIAAAGAIKRMPAAVPASPAGARQADAAAGKALPSTGTEDEDTGADGATAATDLDASATTTQAALLPIPAAPIQLPPPSSPAAQSSGGLASPPLGLNRAATGAIILTLPGGAAAAGGQGEGAQPLPGLQPEPSLISGGSGVPDAGSAAIRSALDLVSPAAATPVATAPVAIVSDGTPVVTPAVSTPAAATDAAVAAAAIAPAVAERNGIVAPAAPAAARLSSSTPQAGSPSSTPAPASVPSTAAVLGPRSVGTGARRVALADEDGKAPLSGVAASVLGMGAPVPSSQAQPVAAATQAPLDTRDPSWITQLADRIAQAEAGTGKTSIRLSPDALGAVQVSVRRVGGRFAVSVDADEPQAQALLAQAQPQLVALAAARGVTIDTAPVSSPDAHGAGTQTAASFMSNSNGGGSGGSADGRAPDPRRTASSNLTAAAPASAGSTMRDRVA